MNITYPSSSTLSALKWCIIHVFIFYMLELFAHIFNLYVYLLAIAGQPAGPNGLFVEGTWGLHKLKILNFYFKNYFFCWSYEIPRETPGTSALYF